LNIYQTIVNDLKMFGESLKRNRPKNVPKTAKLQSNNKVYFDIILLTRIRCKI